MASAVTVTAGPHPDATMTSRHDDVVPLVVDDHHDDLGDLDDLSRRLRREALEALEEEPELSMLLRNTVLAPGVRTFEEAVACTVTYRLLLRPCHTMPGGVGGGTEHPPAVTSPATSLSSSAMFCPYSLRGIIIDALHSSTVREAGHTMAEAVRLDALAVCERDPAVDSILEVVLFLKGFAALVCHRAAYYRWHGTRRRNDVHNGSTGTKKSMTALWLQSQASAVFGLDIHPAATIGAGVLFDHGTGIVIGETATVGDGCTLLHGVTLGGTGKETGDRHPKVGHDVLIGAGASLLGNIAVGDGSKIGAGSIVLRDIPAGATAVGAPAKIVGRAREAKPASTMDETLQQVRYFHKSESASTLDTVPTSVTTTTSSGHSSHRSNLSPLPTDRTVNMVVHDAMNANDEIEDGRTRNTSETSNNETTMDEDTDSSGAFVQSADARSEGREMPKDSESTRETATQNRASTMPPVANPKAKSATKGDCCCPYRDYLRLSSHAPPRGNVNVCHLRHALEPEGFGVSAIGRIMFALDTKGVGYVKAPVFFTPATRDVIVEVTGLPTDRVTTILADLHRQWSQEQTLLSDGNKAKATDPAEKGTSAAAATRTTTTMLTPSVSAH